MTTVAEPVIEPLLRAAAGPRDDLRETIGRGGAERIAAIAVEEILARCEAPALSTGITIGVDLIDGGRVLPYRFTFAGAEVHAAAGRPRDPAARIRYDLVSLARALYGPGGDDGFSVEVCWPPADDLGVVYAAVPPLGRAVEALLSACRHGEPNLDRLAARYGSDKWGCLHWYTPHYARHFAPLRDEPVRLLEIGIGGYQDPRAGGASLRMWQRYFRRGLVYGLDLFPKPAVRGPRIRTLQGDQSDPQALAAIAAEHGPFDIVIDDGSHVNEHVLVSLHALFNHLRSGGLYVIEDMQTSYWPAFGGTDRRPAAAGTTLGFLPTLLDGLHYRECGQPAGRPPSALDRHLVGLHVYHNIAFLEKGDNNESGAPPWMPRESLS
jgi:hypothetical protein